MLMQNIEDDYKEFSYSDKDIQANKEWAIVWTNDYNTANPLDFPAQRLRLEKNLGAIGKNISIEQNFNCDNGKNIFIGDNFKGHSNLTISDIGEVHIGANVSIGPSTVITTVDQPDTPMARREGINFSREITIGDDVWIGGNVSVLPGVNIGNNVIIQAGSVVLDDIPDNTLVAGNPAKKVRNLINDLKKH